ncbi:MAG: hypothetical protein K8H88_06115 [Sandaracinaceae bacterium]|nr:hypothetical protein [Sandaracinaceae bacterium]
MPLPDEFRARIERALENICERIGARSATVETHQLLEITGLTVPELLDDVATYLVGLRMESVSSLLEVRDALTDSATDRDELLRNVVAIVGDPPSSLSPKAKSDERNPWLAEALWFLCLHAANYKPALHPYGKIMALAPPHVHPKDHGLDVAGLFRSDELLGLSAVETKAYENHPDNALSEAVATFRKMDKGEFDQRARQIVSLLRQAMTPADQARVSPSLWQQRRAYIANPHYDSSTGAQWTGKRPSLSEWPKGVVIGACIMPHPIDGFAAYFDGLALRMYEIAREFASMK